MKSNNINDDEWSEEDKPQKYDRVPINKSVLITVFLIAFTLWNCGSTGMFFVFGKSIHPVWLSKDAGEVIFFELGALVSAGMQSYAFAYICILIHGLCHGFDKIG